MYTPAQQLTIAYHVSAKAFRVTIQLCMYVPVQHITIAQPVIAEAFRVTIQLRMYGPAQHITIAQPVIAKAATTLPCFAQLYVPFSPPSEPAFSAALLH